MKKGVAMLLLFVLSVYFGEPHPQPPLGVKGVAQLSFFAFGGKNSSIGKQIFLKVSQGSSVSQQHSFVGIQKSYAGISICTSLSSCTIVKIPRVTLTTFSQLQQKLPLKHLQMLAGTASQPSPNVLQQS